MKRIFVEIKVEVKNNLPTSFVYKARSFTIVNIENRWIVQGKWWENEEKRIYFKVRTETGLAVIYHRKRKFQPEKTWVLEEIFD